MMRNCTGKPTGGPNTKRSTRTRACGTAPSGDRPLEPGLDALARLEVPGDDDDLGEVGVRQRRIETQPEARRALADIGRVGHDVRIARRAVARPAWPSASVAPMAVPSGSRSSKNSSGRVEVGKNCCWTRPKPPTPAMNISTVASTTVLRRARHQRDRRGAGRDRAGVDRSRPGSWRRACRRSRAAASSRDRA